MSEQNFPRSKRLVLRVWRLVSYAYPALACREIFILVHSESQLWLFWGLFKQELPYPMLLKQIRLWCANPIRSAQVWGCLDNRKPGTHTWLAAILVKPVVYFRGIFFRYCYHPIYISDISMRWSGIKVIHYALLVLWYLSQTRSSWVRVYVGQR